MTFQVFLDLYEPWVILISSSTKYFVWLETLSRVQCMLKWKISTLRNRKIIFLRYHLLNATTKWATCAYHCGPLGASDIKDGISYQFHKGRLRHIFPNKPNEPETVSSGGKDWSLYAGRGNDSELIVDSIRSIVYWDDGFWGVFI